MLRVDRLNCCKLAWQGHMICLPPRWPVVQRARLGQSSETTYGTPWRLGLYRCILSFYKRSRKSAEAGTAEMYKSSTESIRLASRIMRLQSGCVTQNSKIDGTKPHTTLWHDNSPLDGPVYPYLTTTKTCFLQTSSCTICFPGEDDRLLTGTANLEELFNCVTEAEQSVAVTAC